MASVIKLQFLTASGEKSTISISNANPDIASEQVEDLMDGIIVKNIFTTKDGDLTAKVKADIVTTSSKVYNYDISDEPIV